MMENKKTLALRDEELNIVSGGASVAGTGTKNVAPDDSCNSFVCASCDGRKKLPWSKDHYCVVFDIPGAEAQRSCTCENCRHYIRLEGVCGL